MKFTVNDTFRAVRLIKAANLKERIKSVATNQQNAEEIGFDIIYEIMTACSEKTAQNELYELLGGLLDISAKAVGELSPFELVDALKKNADLKEFIDFFADASKLAK